MTQKHKLTKRMTVEQFDNGYWYATEVKAFAREIGVRGASRLRKDELEVAVKHFLRTGAVRQPKRNLETESVIKDVDVGLSLELSVRRYANDQETKEFIVESAKRIDKQFKEKSGARYRLNRWREARLARGKKITYKDLVKQYIRLCKVEGRFPQAPSGRYINFLSDFLSKEKNVTRADALRAWKRLKSTDIPKNYRSWKKFISSEA